MIMNHTQIHQLVKSGRYIIIIHDRIYDVTAFVDKHPGGPLVLEHARGKDITDVFTEFHPKSTWTFLQSYFIGVLSDENRVKKSQLDVDRIKLKRAIRANGWDRIQWLDLLQIVLRSFSFLLFSLYCFVQAKKYTSWIGLSFGSIGLGMFFQQMAFLGHDAGHNSVTTKRNIDTWIGYIVGNFASGISMLWWKSSHNVHHMVCNSIENDPDIQHLPMIACSDSIINLCNQNKFYSSYHKKWIGLERLSRVILSVQHYFFYPLMMVARFNLYFQSFYKLISDTSGIEISHQWIEKIMLILHFLWHSLFISYYTWNIQSLLYVVFITHAVAGILHIQIIMSHFAMSVYSGIKVHQGDWFTNQFNTTMNINSSPWMDWFHGGLQFQIEHHLFPKLPRYHLRSVSTLVVPFCKRNGLPYVSVSFWEGMYMVYQALRSAAIKAWNTMDQSDQLIIDALNIRG
jgi:acyl-lipid Delta6-acetylenase / acyl-lipid (9-3)-desaturase